jgi:hypothetical protein
MYTPAGKVIDLLHPGDCMHEVDIGDIAHSLSQQCRYNGLTERFYSVAEHSIYVAQLVRLKKMRPVVVLAALLHDAHEAYIGDLIQPIKDVAELGEHFLIIERGWEALMRVHFGLTGVTKSDWIIIHQADKDMAAMEMRDITTFPRKIWEKVGTPPPRESLKLFNVMTNPLHARNAFLGMYHDLRETVDGENRAFRGGVAGKDWEEG